MSIELPAGALAFVTERHLATLTTLRSDGRPHVVPVGFTYDPGDGRIRIVTRAHSVKARNAARGSVAHVCQVDGGRWITLEGRAELRTDDEAVERCGSMYEVRYGHPPRRPGWASLEITVDRWMGRVAS